MRDAPSRNRIPRSTEPRQPSTRGPDGRFENPIAARDPAMLEALKEWIRSDAPTRPDAPIPTDTRRAHDFATPPAGGLRITWLGHGTSLVEIGGGRFLIDPVWAERASPVPFAGPKRFFAPPLPLQELPPLDAVLLTHDHYDHLDRRTVQWLAGRGVPFVCPLELGRRLIGWGVAAARVRELDWWESVEVGGVTITATPARHFSGRSPFMRDRDRSLWCGFVLAGGGRRVWCTGDTGDFPGFGAIGEALGPFDATLIEIGAYNRLWADIHVGPEQAVSAFLRAGGGLMVPVHWATFDLAMHGWTEPVERLLVEASRTGATVVVPRPGQSVDPDHLQEIERWWPDLPWQTAAEHPVVSSGVGE